MTTHNHLAIADTFTSLATVGAAFGWLVGWLTPAMTLLVLFLGAIWYVIQISGSDWWKQRARRKHRAKVRRKRRLTQHRAT